MQPAFGSCSGAGGHIIQSSSGEGVCQDVMKDADISIFLNIKRKWSLSTELCEPHC